MSDCVLARERLEIGDVARAQFFSEFQTGRSMNTTHVTLMMRRNAHGSEMIKEAVGGKKRGWDVI